VGNPRFVALVFSLGAFALLATGEDSCSTETKSTPDKPSSEGASNGASGESSDNQTAKLGDTITLEGADTKIAVMVSRVLDPPSVGQFDQPLNKGSRLVGIEIALENVGDKTYSDSPSNGATLVLSNDQQADSTIVTGGECSGGFAEQATIAPGSRRTGCIVFEVPGNTPPKTFQFALDSGFGPQTGEWTLG
jgi:hypothetical protein